MLRTTVLGALCALTACSSVDRHGASLGKETTFQLVLTSDVQFDQLNPARGDQSPEAGTLWGDRSGPPATGFLFHPVDGFESPPHIHNVTYRGVVIRGEVHNDDPEARPMWMPARSFWTQPKGQVHITSARGANTLAYIEIDQGPYLVMPPEEAFPGAEQPINVHSVNLVWVEAPVSGDGGAGDAAVSYSYLWQTAGSSGKSGTFVRLPPGQTASLRSDGATIRAVLIQGSPRYLASNADGEATLEPGTYFSSTGAASHRITADGDEPTILYVRADGAFHEHLSVEG